MKDGIIKGTGNSRKLKSSIPATTTFAEFLSMLRAGTLPIDLNGINSAGWNQIGTALNKANLLTDAVAAKYGLGGTAVPNDVLDCLSLLFGDDEPTTATAAATGQIYFDRTHEGWWGCIGKSGGSYLWKKMKPTNSDLFGTRGPIVITSSMTFDASTIGLKVGDRVNVICIGGGGGGGAGGTDQDDPDRYGYGAAGSDGGTNGGYGSGGAGGAGGRRYGGSVGGGGGGGSGYVVADTITLTSLSVPVTIGVHGVGGPKYGFETGSSGTNGTATSFGNYLTAPGGGGGKGGKGYNPLEGGQGGAGGNAGANGSNGNSGGAGGAGGAGLVSTAFPSAVPSTSPTLSANGAVLIWY